MAKTCLECGAKYELETTRCPTCGSTNFIGGASSSEEIGALFDQFDRESVTLTNQGIRALNEGALDEAIRCSRAALELDPDEARAYGTIGLALAQRGRTKEAIGYLERALSIDVSLEPLPSILAELRAQQGSDTRCFIASACYGSSTAPEVVTLRRFRDTHLMPSPWGARLVQAYYLVSPSIAAVLRRWPALRGAVRSIVVAPAARAAGRRRGCHVPDEVRFPA